MFYHATEIRFVVRRINFLDENGKIRLDKNGNEMSAPFPSVIVFFGPKQKFTTPKISMMEVPQKRKYRLRLWPLQKVSDHYKKLDIRLKKMKIGEISLFAIIEKSDNGPIWSWLKC